MIWMVNAVEETEVMKTEVGKFAKELNGGSALLKTESSKNIKVCYETIADLLNNFYSNLAINLKQTDKQRRTRPRFHHTKKIQDSIFHNKYIVTLDQGNDLHLESDDYEQVITHNAT